MKTYKELMEEQRKKGSFKTLTPEFKRFEEQGDSVLGRLTHVETVSNREDGSEFNQYLFDTDNGPVKFMLGSAGDHEIGSQMKIGGVYYVEFQGKEKTSRGYQVNKFNVVEIDGGGIDHGKET
jgi:hypothetical protein